MRLADTCLVLSKFRAKGQVGILYLSVGLISKKLAAELDSNSAVELMVIYEVKNNETFIPLTQFPEDVAHNIAKYSF